MRRRQILLWALVLALLLPPAALGAEEEYREIHIYEDLLAMAEAPDESYRLMEHIDLAGKAWTPIDFSGVLDGNGYTLLNLEVTDVGPTTALTYDGSYEGYETAFGGLFGRLANARVFNLTLLNVKVKVESDQPCFIGAMAGFSDNSLIEGCAVSGTLELTAYDRMFGVGGIVGYGSGSISDTGARVTLICTDTDPQTMDEQFMGGAYAAGYMDLEGCAIQIDGYVSDHGSVHSGGLAGMYVVYPPSLDYQGKITDNSSAGQITFFEDNPDRQAYCNGFIGEVMSWDFVNGGNWDEFTRNEIFTYDEDLRPHSCTGEDWVEAVTEPGCDTFGYTTFQCKVCGYTYADRYTLPKHTPAGDWVTLQAPTAEAEGLQEGTCRLCGAKLTQTLPKLPAAPPFLPTPEPPTPQDPAEGKAWSALWLLPAGLMAGAAVMVLVGKAKKK